MRARTHAHAHTRTHTIYIYTHKLDAIRFNNSSSTMLNILNAPYPVGFKEVSGKTAFRTCHSENRPNFTF